jgi:putative flippase GtrA
VKIKPAKTGWRSNKRLVQFAEFILGGVIYQWSGLGVFAISFDLLHWHWFVSKVLADLTGWSTSYAVQRYWAFYDPRLKGQNRRVIFRYVLINSIDLIFDYAIVAAFIYNQITPYAGFFASAAFTTAWDYLWYRFWVFRPAR